MLRRKSMYGIDGNEATQQYEANAKPITQSFEERPIRQRTSPAKGNGNQAEKEILRRGNKSSCTRNKGESEAPQKYGGCHCE
jgi:hypothetical protein